MGLFTMSSNDFKFLFDNLDKSLMPLNDYYSAHRKDNDLETLEFHSNLCAQYYIYLIESLGLEPIIDNLIIDIFGDSNLTEIKEILLYSVYYHDIGKMNQNFQQAKVNKIKVLKNTKHSCFSEKILISFLVNKYPDLKELIYLAVNTVAVHHTKLHNFKTENQDESIDDKKIFQQIINQIHIKELSISENDKEGFFVNEEYNWNKIFIFVKLIYSLLVLSDSYSTIHYTYNFKHMYPLNIINKDIYEKMVKSYSAIPYNKDIDELCSNSIDSYDDINSLRKEILVEASNNIKHLLKQNNKIFMMAIPTGGGKTNVSMKLALNILEHDEKVNKIFYVFPFINIIEQNYQVIEKALFNQDFFSTKTGLISDIYSRAYMDKIVDTNEDEYVSNIIKRNIIRDDNFLNNSVNIITNVNFFNTFIKNGSNNRYKIANLCNSIVIIDEIQTLSDKNIRTFYNFIKETSDALNIYYIIMSATLPDFKYFLSDITAPQIINDPLKYYNHPIFKRNEIIFKKDIRDVEGIKDLLIEEISTNYSSGNVKILITLNTVATSQKVYDELKMDPAFNDFNFYLLNGTTASLRRKKMIEEIKQKNNDRIIMVSTQSIEAGVDIDCNFGIRDYAILDSIEQISGRINRECNKEKSLVSKLFIISYKEKTPDAKKIYEDQLRYKILLDMEDAEIESILTYKKFDEYYTKLGKEVKKIAKDSFNSTNDKISNLLYSDLNYELNVIDTKIDKIDIFICNKINLNDLSQYDLNKILSLLEDTIIKQTQQQDKIICDGYINTENVYKVWKEIMSSTNKFEDVYIRQKITSLLNQFIVSITNLKTFKNDSLLSFLETEMFIEKDDKFDIYLSTLKFAEYYSYEEGLKLYQLSENFKNSSQMGVII